MKTVRQIMMLASITALAFCLLGAIFSDDAHAIEITLQDQTGQPIRGVLCTVYNVAGEDQGVSGATGPSGQVTFNLPDGGYKFKIDCWDTESWTDVVNATSETALVHTLERPKIEPSFGINLNPISCWKPQVAFVDRFKSTGDWPPAIPADENGYPLELPYNGQTLTAYMAECPEGLYTIYYEGQGSFDFWPANLVQVIHEKPGMTQAYFTPGEALRKFNLILKTSQLGDHLRNIRVVMPGHESTYLKEPFYPPFIQRIGPFDVLCFANIARSKENPDLIWPKRTTPETYTQGRREGAAYEYMIEMANQTGKAPWFTIPENADDEYVHNMAALIRDNLEPELKVYLSPNSTDTVRCVEVFSIFEEEFGSDERLVKILHGAQGGTNYRVNQFIDPVNNPNGITIDAIGLSFRYAGLRIKNQIITEGKEDTITVDEILDRFEDRLFTTELDTIQEAKSVANVHGLSLYVFDTGDYVYYPGDEGLAGKFVAANRNSRIGEIFHFLFDICFNNGVDLVSFFSNVEDHAIGLLESLNQPIEDAPKYQALYSLMQIDKIPVRAIKAGGPPLPNLIIRAYTDEGTYTGTHGMTNEKGIAHFDDFENGIYKFRCDYQGNAIWSETVDPAAGEGIDITIETEQADVSIITTSGSVEGVLVQVFTENGRSTGLSGFTNVDGCVSFDLVAGGKFQFLANISGEQYWSELTAITKENTNSISILASNQWAPAEIFVSSTMAVSSPTRFGANFSSDRQLNEFVLDGCFEPQVDRFMFIATGGNQQHAEGDFSRWDTITDGHYDGATIRAYRIVDDAVTLVRKEIIPEGGYIARTWSPVVGGDIGGGMVPAYQKNQFTDGRRCLYYQQIDLENGKSYYYIVKAVDQSGNTSEASDECQVIPLASEDVGPKIITVGFTNITANESAPGTYDIYKDYAEATGGTEPLIWSVESGSSLPDGLLLNNSTGEISGLPTSDSEAEFTLKVIDSRNRSDTRTFRMNSPEIDPDQNDTTPPGAPQNVRALANNGSVTITWDPNNEIDLAGYIVYRSKFSQSEHQQRINFASSGPAIKEGDLLYIDLIRTDPAFESVSDRVLWNRFTGGEWGLRVDNNDWRFWSDPVTKWKQVSFHHVPHPGNLPNDFVNHGKTCLKLGTGQSEKIGIQQYRFGHPGGYYPPLKRNHTYRLSMWMRQEGISTPGIRFRMSGDYSYIDHSFSDVDGEWRKFEWDFMTRADYPNNSVIDYQIEFLGPGTLWIDNVSIYDPELPHHAVLPEVVQSFSDFHPGSLRIWSGQTNTVNGTTLENWTNPDDVHMPYADVFCLPTALQLCKESRATPWLIVGPYMDEEEWKGLIDYLAGDASTKYGAKRIAQRGGDETPWSDEFDKIIIELGNETWNGLFEPWTYNQFGSGTLFGQFGEYWFNQAKASPSWNAGLEDKVHFALGNWSGQNNGTLENRGIQALAACPTANILVEAMYNGGWEAGYIAGGNTFNDKGVQDLLMYGPRSNHLITNNQIQTQKLAADIGLDYQLCVYESGPGYDHKDPNNRPANQYGRSLASGVATLDSHLYNAYYGFKDQCFFMFRTGGYTWSSHNLWEFGRQEQTAWQALKMRNLYANGDMLVTAALSEPTGSFPQEGAYAGLSNAPMIKTYAFSDGNQYAVFILSRKLDNFPLAGDDGNTPVTLRLPFANPSAITLYKLTGDPRANNLGGVDETGNPVPQVIGEQKESIPLSAFSQRFVVDQTTGGAIGGMPPGSIYLYVFDGVETPDLPLNPQVFVNPISHKPAPGPGDVVHFRVIFDRPVTGFGDSADDVLLEGTSNPTTAEIVELNGYKGTTYDLAVSGMKSIGTLSVTIPSGAAEAVSNRAPNTPSISTGSAIVKVKTGQGAPHAGVTVSAYTLSGEPTGIRTVTTFDGQAHFPTDQFPPGEYKFKIKCLGYEYWSGPVTISAGLVVEVIIDIELLQGDIILPGGPEAGVKVYLYPEDGTEIGISTETDISGSFSFNVPVDQNYKVMTEVLGNQYWSDVVTISGGNANTIAVNTGGGLLQVTLQDEAGVPITGTPLTLYTTEGLSLEKTEDTDASGTCRFYVTEGAYRTRAKYLSNEFIGPEIQLSADLTMDFVIPHQSVEITVQSNFQGVIDPLSEAMVCLYSENGADIGQNGKTDANGKVVFRLPEISFRARTNCLGATNESNVFAWQDKTITIPMGLADVFASWNETPLGGVDISVFSSTGVNLNARKSTDLDGKASFLLPAGDYKFSLLNNNKEFWSDTITLMPDQIVTVPISSGKRFELVLRNQSGTPVRGVSCSVYNDLGENLGINGFTDKSGQVVFNLPDGAYQFKIACWDMELWTDVVELSGNAELIQTLEQPQLQPALGVKLNTIGYSKRQLVFTDMMKTAMPWKTSNSHSVSGGENLWDTGVINQIPCDENGYPLELPYEVPGTEAPQMVGTLMLRAQGGHYPGGVYTVYFDGNGELDFGFAATIIHEEQGKILIDVNPDSSGGILMNIKASEFGNHIRNIRIFPPGLEPNDEKKVFYAPFLERVQHLNVLDFSEVSWVNTNSAPVWDDRILPDYYTQGGTNGPAIEYLIELSNQTNIDPWFTIPSGVDDNYISSLAALVRDSLSPNLKVRISYNSPSNLVRNAEVFHLFNEAFGDKTRVRNVYLAANTNRMKQFQDPAYNPYGAAVDAVSISFQYDGLAIGNAINGEGLADTITVEELLDRIEDYLFATELPEIIAAREVADTYGLPLYVRDAGDYSFWPSIEGLSGKFVEANRAPRIKEIISAMLDVCFNNGVDVVSFFSNVDAYASGLLEYQNQPTGDAPKYQAVWDFAAEWNAPPEITLTSPAAPVYANGDTVEITWEDTDPDNNAIISIYYDDDDSDQDGVLIATGQKENPDGDQDSYSWVINAMDEGDYYIYAIINDPFCSRHAYAPAPVHIGPKNISLQVLTDGGSALSGLKVYVFTESGSYTGKYAKTDADGNVSFSPDQFSPGSYKFRVGHLGYQFWSDTVTLPETTRNQMIIPMETARISVAMAGGPVDNVKVYLFSDSGSYLGQYQRTDGDGSVSFELPEGLHYKFRADVMGTQYWTGPALIQDGDINDIDLDTGGGLLQVTLQKEADNPVESVKLYLFKSTGAYLGKYQVSDAQGRTAFNVSEGIYKIRADYMGYQFWTEDVEIVTDTAIDFTLAHTEVAVTVNALYQETSAPVSGIKAYLFNTSGAYLGSCSTTNEYGQVFLDLPDQTYKVRVDYLGRQYWSEEFIGQDATVGISMADAQVTVTGSGLPQEGIRVYLFSASGSYLGLYQTTDADGQVVFRIPEGCYKFRADYQGAQFWSVDSTLASNMVNPVAVPVGGGSFTLGLTLGDGTPLAGVSGHVFNLNGSYLGITAAANTDGQLFFNLADGSYNFRIDYLGEQFWTGSVAVPDTLSTEMEISHETAEVTVTTGNGPVVGAKVYLFSQTESYLGRHFITDEAGKVSFHLPVGVGFRFRADVLGGQYWSDETLINGGGVNPVAIDTGGGLFEIALQKAPDVPMGDVKLYLFSDAGSYLGQHQVTDDVGHAAFEVPDAAYKVRADYLGYQFWSTTTQVSTDTAIEFTLPHQVVEVTVSELYQTELPLTGIKLYLFAETGSYLGQYQLTNNNGLVTFSLPEKAYMLRTDYLGAQFWTEAFTWNDIDLDISHGKARIHVYQSGEDLTGAEVYLFTENGAYLGRCKTTGDNGTVDFLIPALQPYQFRVDHEDQRVWSPGINLDEGENETIFIELDSGH